jgi:hypothetical protein
VPRRIHKLRHPALERFEESGLSKGTLMIAGGVAELETKHDHVDDPHRDDRALYKEASSLK